MSTMDLRGVNPAPVTAFKANGDLDFDAKAKDYNRAHAIHERLLPVTKAVHHRGSHMEGTCALKLGLVTRGELQDADRPLAAQAPGGRCRRGDGGAGNPAPRDHRDRPRRECR